jgi:hypothetical protein
MMLKPLVRLLISQGVTHSEFSETAKDVYVEVGIRHFLQADSINQSRIAVITGLTRKEVKRVLVRAQKSESFDRTFSRPSRLLTGWHSDPQFLGPYGVPLELKYEDSESSDVPSFKELCRIYGADMSPKAMLDILIDSGAVVEVETGEYKAVRRGFMPSALAPELLERFGYVAHDFFSTAARNVAKEPGDRGLLERVVRSSQPLSPDTIEEMTDYLKENGQEFLEKIDNWIVQHSEADDSPEEERRISGLGIFHYIESPEDKESFRDLLLERGLKLDDETPD